MKLCMLGYHSNKFFSVNMFHESNICSRSQRNEIFSVYRVSWRCTLMGYSGEIADTKKLHQEGRIDVLRCCSVDPTVKR
jgi:hypothetical protein